MKQGEEVKAEGRNKKKLKMRMKKHQRKCALLRSCSTDYILLQPDTEIKQCVFIR